MKAVAKPQGSPHISNINRRSDRLSKQDPRRRFLSHFLTWLRDQHVVSSSSDFDDDFIQKYLDHERELTDQVVAQVAKTAKNPDADPRPGLTLKKKELVP